MMCVIDKVRKAQAKGRVSLCRIVSWSDDATLFINSAVCALGVRVTLKWAMSFDAQLHDQARVVSESNQPHADVRKVAAQGTVVSLSDCDFLKKF